MASFDRRYDFDHLPDHRPLDFYGNIWNKKQCSKGMKEELICFICMYNYALFLNNYTLSQ